ncbi:MAG: peptidylprolyl isomerase, partial [Hyphomicrobium sp.]
MRAKFKDCKSTAQLAAGVAGVRFEDVGKRRPSSFSEPTRSLLLSAKDNEMLPPSVSEDGVDLFAVCGREVIKAEDQKRTKAEGELKQKEFELLAKRHLKDLRQDAHIEYR